MTLAAEAAQEPLASSTRIEARRDAAPHTVAWGGRTVIVVDDGVATGGTDAAALRAIARMHPAHLVLAVPVCVPTVSKRLAEDADEVVCLLEPAYLDGVGYWFHDFSQVSDDEVVELLGRDGDGSGGGA